MTAFSHVGLVVRQQDHSVADTLHDIHGLLKRKGCTALFEHSTSGMVPGVETLGFDDIGARADLAIVVGGDGTLLSTARELVDSGVPLVGVNRGRLGFLTDVHPDEKLLQLAAILDGDYVPDERLMLRMDVERDGEVLYTDSAFNDVVIRNTQMLRIVDFEVYIDGSFVNHQRADGIIVSTPSGSTAYALSNGGPIVNPQLQGIILQPICPHTLSSRPLVVPEDCTIEIVVCDDGAPNAQAVCDGQLYHHVQRDDIVRVRRKRRHLTLLHPSDYDYFQILRAKLNWR
ncbi:MAG: NAD(+) kinase [Pseudomonadota bacterium]